MMNIRSKQRNVVEKMLQLGGNTTTDVQQWKVLIYDKPSRDIISPLLTIAQLRDLGVTLHMLLESQRETIPDVPAVYFIRPTQENIRRFVQDCRSQLYDSAYLNFSSPISQEMLSFLARSLVEINAVNVVSKVFDQYLDFVALEPLLFSLNMSNSFSSYNSPSLADAAIEQCMEDTANGLCATICTLGSLPIIRCPRGGPAEMVARKLSEKLRVISGSPDGPFSSSIMDQRPMLLIVDRNIDMSTPLIHTSKYQTLVDDLLDFRLNRVKVEPKANKQGPPSTEAAKVYSLDKEKDTFWSANSGNLFHLAVEAQAAELKDVEREEEKIKLHTGTDVSKMSGRSDGETSALLSTVHSLPVLLERKKYLQMHLEILGGIMAVVSKRHVHRYVDVEESLIYSQYAEKNAVTDLLGDPGLQYQDKVRLFATYMMIAHPSTQEVEELEGMIMQSYIEDPVNHGYRAALTYIKRIMSLNRFGKDPVSQPAKSAAGANSFWDIASMTRDALENAGRQVKNMVGASKVLPAVRMMQIACRDATSENSAREQDSQLLYIDPKVQGEVMPNARIRSAFQRGILFVVGGGCISEYLNLQDLVAGKLQASGAVLRLGSESNKGKSFMYGCTEVLNPSRFVEQLAQCQ